MDVLPEPKRRSEALSKKHFLELEDRENTEELLTEKLNTNIVEAG
jgi:hypothetical protein